MTDWVGIALSAGKAFFVVMFAMNVAVLLTWADRRQGAVIQDRIGPNRAVIWLPTPLAQGLALLPALGLGALALLYAKSVGEEPRVPTRTALLLSQLGIFLTWLTGLALSGRVRAGGVRSSFDAFLAALGDPRRFFYAGLFAHAASAAVLLSYRGTRLGRSANELALYGGAALLALAALSGAAYAAHAVRGQPRVGLRLFGLLHPAADGLKTLFKEDFIPPNADRFLHGLAPLISFFPALVVLAVVPFGDSLCFGADPETGGALLSELAQRVPRSGACAGASVPLQVVSLDVGILYFFALAGTGIVGAALAGWASDNKFSLLGGVRAASQMVSYEVTMGLALIGAFMIYGTLRVEDMVRWQAENTWGIFVQPLAFFLFFAAAVAESKRIPFDLPEGESEIVAGYFTEYAGMKFAMFFFAEYIAVVTSSALIAALFLGGWHLPFVERHGISVAIGQRVFFEQALPHGLVVLLGFLGFIAKTITLCWLQLTIRWTLPRFRYDQLMRLGWRKLLPASLINILVTGVIVIAIAEAGAAVQKRMALLADLSMALVALLGLGGLVAFVLFLLSPVDKPKMLASTSAKFAAAMGGRTPETRMQA